MEHSTDDYRISFFKPTTPQARSNRNMVIWLVSIWFIAIFGFQILLLILQKPTPQPAYETFNEIWGNIETETPAQNDLQKLGQASLSVFGKINIDPTDKEVIENTLSWSVYQLTDEDQREELIVTVRNFEEIRAEMDNINNPEYNSLKNKLSTELAPLLDLPVNNIKSAILPLALSSDEMMNLTGFSRERIPGIMKNYLVHNQSVLTDTKFLGFPFHYFYTAIFLLILFVGLCWLYCVKTDRINAKLNIAD